MPGENGKSPFAARVEAGDEGLKVEIAHAASGEPGPGDIADLSSCIEGLEDLTDRAVALDAAIRASLDSRACTGSTYLERAETLKRRFPRHAAEIDRTVWLDQFIGPVKAHESGRDTRAGPAVDEVGPPLPSGRLRYRLISPIGTGSNGCVYLAQDRLLSSEGAMARVAIKLVSAESGDRAIEEARRMRVVEHPNVVQVRDFGRSPDGRPFIVQEYVRGQHLGEWLEDTTPSKADIVRVMAEVAEGVQAIHSAGLVHHDLKPQNVLIATDGAVKVADFGSSGRYGDEDTRQAGFGPGPGTLAFMAPERLRLLDIDPMPCSDVFSLGAMLHWMLTGHAAAGDAPAAALAALADPQNTFTHLHDVHQQARIGRDLGLIVRRAASTKIESRHPSAERYAQDLRDWLAHKPIGWTRPGVGRQFRLFVRRRPFVVGALALIVMSLGAAAFAGRAAYIQSVAAAENRRLADVEHQRVETETAWKQKTGQSLRRLLGSFASVKQQGLASEVLTSLWILEWSQGPLLLDDPSALRTIWDERIGVLERLRATLDREGKADSIGAHLVEPSLALWYLRDGQTAPALEVLGEALRFWGERCSADDPWLEDIRALHALAIVLGSRESPDSPSSRDASGVSVESARAYLLGYQADATSNHEEPIRELVRETLDRIGQKGGLN